MSTAKTLVDTIYAKPFPSHTQVCDFILSLPDRGVISKSDAVMWYAEMGIRQYNGMKKIFESKGDATIIKDVGQMCYDTFEDTRQMQAVYYVYMHIVKDMAHEFAAANPDETRAAIYHIAKHPLDWHWHGIGDDKYGWRH